MSIIQQGYVHESDVPAKFAESPLDDSLAKSDSKRLYWSAVKEVAGCTELPGGGPECFAGGPELLRR